MNIAKGTVSKMILPAKPVHSKPILVGPSGDVSINCSFTHDIELFRYQLEVFTKSDSKPVEDKKLWDTTRLDNEHYQHFVGFGEKSFIDIHNDLVPKTYVRLVITQLIGVEKHLTPDVNYNISSILGNSENC